MNSIWGPILVDQHRGGLVGGRRQNELSRYFRLTDARNCRNWQKRPKSIRFEVNANGWVCLFSLETAARPPDVDRPALICFPRASVDVAARVVSAKPISSSFKWRRGGLRRGS